MQRRFNRIVTVVALLAFCAALSACADFDPENLDVFHLNEKKKLPGERKALFPDGVPGVSEGVPPELVKGHQPPPDTAIPATADVTPATTAAKPATADSGGMTPARRAALQAQIAPSDEKPKPKTKPKPRVVKRAPEKPPAQVTVQPAQKPAAQQTTGAQAPWPATQPQQQTQQQQGTQAPWPNAQQPSSAPWPSSPPPGTFSR